MDNLERPDWDVYFLDIAKAVAQRSTCPRLKVGAVVVKDKKIRSTGFNGVAQFGTHCTDGGCYLVDGHCLKAVHAEINAVIGIDNIRYSTMYVTHSPCLRCMGVIINAGIKRVVYGEQYGPPIDYQTILGFNNNTMPALVHFGAPPAM